MNGLNINKILKNKTQNTCVYVRNSGILFNYTIKWCVLRTSQLKHWEDIFEATRVTTPVNIKQYKCINKLQKAFQSSLCTSSLKYTVSFKFNGCLPGNNDIQTVKHFDFYCYEEQVNLVSKLPPPGLWEWKIQLKHQCRSLLRKWNK